MRRSSVSVRAPRRHFSEQRRFWFLPRRPVRPHSACSVPGRRLECGRLAHAQPPLRSIGFSITETERTVEGCKARLGPRRRRSSARWLSVARAGAAAGAVTASLELADLPAAVELDSAAGAQQLAQLRAPSLHARFHSGNRKTELWPPPPPGCDRRDRSGGSLPGTGSAKPLHHRRQAGSDLAAETDRPDPRPRSRGRAGMRGARSATDRRAAHGGPR